MAAKIAVAYAPIRDNAQGGEIVVACIRATKTQSKLSFLNLQNATSERQRVAALKGVRFGRVAIVESAS